MYEISKDSGVKTKPKTEKIILEKGQNYLSETGLTKLPSGLIAKNYTGIGATTLEMKSNRSSILVFPTVSLASSKAKKADKKYEVHYIGSSDDETPISSIEAVVKDLEKQKVVKLFVVVDSYIKLHQELKNANLLNDVFVLFDEIDTFQSESTYRTKMEIAVDLFFELDQDKRAMMTATNIQSVHPKFKTFINKYQVLKEDHQKEKLSIVLSMSNIHKDAADIIKKLAGSTNTNLLIAYNSIENIHKIIELLGEAYQDKVSILSSERSKANAGKYFERLKDSKLPKQINFITSAYFVGIDIEDSAHTIIISNPSATHSLLTKSKIIQILGRVRNKRSGSKNIFITRLQPALYEDNSYRDLNYYNKRFVLFRNFLNKLKTETNIPDAKLKELLDSQVEDGIQMMREQNVEYVLNRFCIDYFLMVIEAYKTLNYSEDELKTYLAHIFDITLNKSYRGLSNVEQETLRNSITPFYKGKIEKLKNLVKNYTPSDTTLKGQNETEVNIIDTLRTGNNDYKQIKKLILKIIEENPKDIGRSVKRLKGRLFLRSDTNGKIIKNLFEKQFKINTFYQDDVILNAFIKVSTNLRYMNCTDDDFTIYDRFIDLSSDDILAEDKKTLRRKFLKLLFNIKSETKGITINSKCNPKCYKTNCE